MLFEYALCILQIYSSSLYSKHSHDVVTGYNFRPEMYRTSGFQQEFITKLSHFISPSLPPSLPEHSQFYRVLNFPVTQFETRIQLGFTLTHVQLQLMTDTPWRYKINFPIVSSYEPPTCLLVVLAISCQHRFHFSIFYYYVCSVF